MATPSRATAARSTDVLVVGGGLAALTATAALVRRGLSVRLVAERRAGEASPAAAGMLAPSLEAGDGDQAAHRFSLAARDRYPAFLDWLAGATGARVPLNREGILRVALTDAEGGRLRDELPRGTRWLDAPALADLEPALAHAAGAAFFPGDGAVDNVALVEALWGWAGREPRVVVEHAIVARLSFTGEGVEVAAAGDGSRRWSAPRAVLAAGAWTGEVAGLPRPIPVEPVRGQMLALEATPLRHVVYGPGGYVVPRGAQRVLVGSTMERVGFDAATTAEGVAHLRRVAEGIYPALASAPELERWAGLRPVTPDLLPILGADPEEPRLVYACGYSRNGILLSPLAGECVAAVAAGETPPFDLAPFAPTRLTHPGPA